MKIPESIQWVAAGLFFVAAIYCGVKGFVRRMQQSWSIKAHLYQARYFSVAVLLIATAMGIYYETCAAVLIVPLMLCIVWLEYWLYRR